MKEKRSNSSDIQEAIKAISLAASEAVKTISAAAADARSVVSANAAEAAKIVTATTSGDHDLLVELRSEMRNLKVAVEKLSENDNSYVLKEDFAFWRNILVSGMLLSIFIGVVFNFLK